MVKLIIENFFQIRQIKNPRNFMIELVFSMLNGTETMEIFLLDANKHRNYNNDLFNAIKIFFVGKNEKNLFFSFTSFSLSVDKLRFMFFYTCSL